MNITIAGTTINTGSLPNWIQIYYHCHEPGIAYPSGIPNFNVTMDPTGSAEWDSETTTSNPGQNLGVHIKFFKFKPTGESVAADPLNVGDTITDVVTSRTDSYWPSLGASSGKSFPVKYCVRMYGPFSVPQTGFSGDYIEKCTGDSDQNPHYTGEGQKRTFNFGSAASPGYYYFRVVIPVIQPDEDTNNLISSKWLADFDPAAPEHERTMVKMKVEAKSQVNGPYFSDTTSLDIIDTLTVKSDAPGGWMNYNHDHNGDGNSTNDPVVARICVTMHGPYQNPKTPNVSIPANESVVGAEKCNNVTNAGDTTFNFGSGSNYEPGYYYFTHTVKNVTNHASDNVFTESSEYRALTPEMIIRQFQPFVESTASSIWVADGTPKIYDTLIPHAAKNSAEANNGYQPAIDKDSYWLNGANAKFCVVPYGPFQTAQEYNEYNSTNPPDIPSGATQIAGAICKTFDGAGASHSQTFEFDSGNWKPGFYYFMSYFYKSSTVPSTPSGLQGNSGNLFANDWRSTFNPKNEKETVADRFQIKPTSQTVSETTSGGVVNTGIIGDANHDGVVGSGEKGTVPVLTPNDKYIEDSFDIQAYDTNGSTDVAKDPKYWLKDLDGEYITFNVCANIYGPYQQPQGAGTSGSTARIPVVGIGQASPLNGIPNNIYGSNTPMAGKEQCFWTDDAVNSSATNGLVQKPNADGGPGEYKIRWNNEGNNYFLPGYYYVVWNVEKAAPNDADTVVDMGGWGKWQKNGDFLESSWWSPFGEQSESFYSPFQPIAESNMPEIAPSSTTAKNSGQKKSEGNEGTILTCDENRDANTINYVDHIENYPKEFLHCQSITDQIWLGAVDNRAIDPTFANEADHNSNANKEAASDNFGDAVGNTNNNKFWPKRADGGYEPLKYQVKLYGPFKDAKYEGNVSPTTTYRVPGSISDTTKAGYVGDSTFANSKWTSLSSTVPNSVLGAQDVYHQPIAESCVITVGGDRGPNWGATTGYNVVFTQDFSSCNGNGENPSNSEILLPPGFYVSVVEIVRDDIVNSAMNPVTNQPILDGDATQSTNGSINNMHNMLIKDRFTSAWGDPKESILVPLPLYIVTRRDNSGEDTFIDQVTINDQYWVSGFDSEFVCPADGTHKGKMGFYFEQDCTPGEKYLWKDIFGGDIPKYGEYSGDTGYFNGDDSTAEIDVKLYGPYPLKDGRPNEDPKYCNSSMLVRNGWWKLPAEDVGGNGKNLPYPAPLTLTEKGWYIFQYEYHGGDRINDIKTQCGDTSEMFRIVTNDIGLVTTAGSDNRYAPTRITDTVTVTGSFTDDDKNSIVKLSLYKGSSKSDGELVCMVIFTVDKAGAYNTKDYIDEKGYIKEGQKGSGRCYSETGGHYFWIEEFLRPGSDPLNPKPSDNIQPPGEGKPPEDIDILPPPKPEVTTDADPTTSVNKPFRDIALVTNIPEGSTKKYKLWFEAYGPYADGQVNCSSNLIYSNQSSPETITKNGSYYSEYITVSTTGLVYWVEHLDDEEGNTVDKGECGVHRETTYVIGPEVPPGNPFEPFQVNPLYPNAGYIARQVGKIIVLGIISMLGAWQLTNKNSWLLRKR